MTKQTQLEKAKAEIDINTNLIKVVEKYPTKVSRLDLEWWVMVLLALSNYNDVTKGKLKLKMRNLRAKANLQREICGAAFKGEQMHADRNIFCKLKTEHCEREKGKLFDDPKNLETLVSIFNNSDLLHPQTFCKVGNNAKKIND